MSDTRYSQVMDMEEKNRRHIQTGIWVSIAGIAIMLILSAWAWTQVPDGALVPIHWGVDGQPNAYGSKYVGLLAIPAVMTFAATVFWWRMPKKYNLALDQTAVFVSWYGSLLLLFVVHGMLVAIATGHQAPVAPVVATGVGVLLCVVGGLMAAGKVHRNAGAKGRSLLWPALSDGAMDKINRLGGRMMCIMGAGAVVSGVSDNLLMFSAVVLIGATILITTTRVYAAIYSRRGD